MIDLKTRERAYKAILKKGYALPAIEECRFSQVLDCVVAIGWGGWEAMYSPITGKVVKPYRV